MLNLHYQQIFFSRSKLLYFLRNLTSSDPWEFIHSLKANINITQVNLCVRGLKFNDLLVYKFYARAIPLFGHYESEDFYRQVLPIGNTTAHTQPRITSGYPYRI